MSWFTKFDSWVKSIGDKTIKPVAKVAVYIPATILGIPEAGALINNGWTQQEGIIEQQNQQLEAQKAAAEATTKVKNIISSVPNWMWFVGFLTLLYFVTQHKKRRK